MPNGKSFGITQPAVTLVAKVTIPSLNKIALNVQRRAKPVFIPLPIELSTLNLQWFYLRDDSYMSELLSNFCFFRAEKTQPPSVSPHLRIAEKTSSVVQCCGYHATCNNVEDAINGVGGIANFYFLVAYQLYQRLTTTSNKRKRVENVPEKLELILYPEFNDNVTYYDCLHIGSVVNAVHSSPFYLTLHRSLLPGRHVIVFNGLLNVESPLLDTDAFLLTSNTNVVVDNVYKNVITLTVNRAINIEDSRVGYVIGRIDTKYIDVITDLTQNYKFISMATPNNENEMSILPQLVMAFGVNNCNGNSKSIQQNMHDQVYAWHLHGVMSASIGAADLFSSISKLFPDVKIAVKSLKATDGLLTSECTRISYTSPSHAYSDSKCSLRIRKDRIFTHTGAIQRLFTEILSYGAIAERAIMDESGENEILVVDFRGMSLANMVNLVGVNSDVFRVTFTDDTFTA